VYHTTALNQPTKPATPLKAESETARKGNFPPTSPCTPATQKEMLDRYVRFEELQRIARQTYAP